MRPIWKWIIAGAVGGPVLQAILVPGAFQPGRAQSPKSPMEIPATPEQKKAAQTCKGYVLSALVVGILPKVDMVKEGAHAAITVNAGPWYRLQFEQKLALAQSVECAAAEGRDFRFWLYIYDSQNHKKIGYFDGFDLTVY